MLRLVVGLEMIPSHYRGRTQQRHYLWRAERRHDRPQPRVHQPRDRPVW